MRFWNFNLCNFSVKSSSRKFSWNWFHGKWKFLRYFSGSTHYVWTNGEGYMWGTQSTHKSIEGRRKKRCVAVKCFEGSGRYRRWFERISTLVVCKTPFRSEYNKVDSQSSLSHLFGKAYIPNGKWAKSEKDSAINLFCAGWHCCGSCGNIAL